LGLGAVVALGGLALYAPPSRRSRRPRALRPLLPVALGGITLGICAGVPRMGPDFYWVHTDHLGTPLVATGALIDPIVVWRASYSAFGEATVEANPGGYGSIVLNYRLPGQFFDAETGLHYNFYRTYDPRLGRYLEPDPIGQPGGINLYLYARNNPVGIIDPFGLFGTLDFVKNYFRRNPSPVNLGGVGLGPAFESSPSVSSAISAFNARLERKARAAAAAACEKCPPDGTTTGFSIADPTTTNVLREPGLFAVGGSHFFRRGGCSVSVTCTTGEYSYSCSSDFGILDSFSDPLEGEEMFGFPLEVPGGTPYPIIHSFRRTTSGGGRL
jgi:RHS repeat-associated protein